MDTSKLAPLTLEGWFVLHQFLRVPRPPDDDGGREGARARARKLQDLLSGWRDLGEDGWSGLYRIVGGSADYMLVHFRPTLEELGEVERTLRHAPAARDLLLAGDYVSVTELALYHLTSILLNKARETGIEPGSPEWGSLTEDRLADEREKSHVRARLYPTQPEDMPYLCFYPMDKRRNRGQNWYTLPVEDRAAMMQDHGRTGRKYSGRVSQVISGSVGFDDWEWAVTLFAGDPLEFKTLITEMRYDEVSAVYAEFGSFWVGHRIPADGVAEELSP